MNESAATKRANYIARHWHGELLLGVSYWAKGILGYVLIAALAGFVSILIGTIGLKAVAEDSRENATRPEGLPQPAASPVPAASSGSEYIVMKGDSFCTIAKKFRVSMKEIQEANPSVQPAKLQVGQQLHIPSVAPTPASTGQTPTVYFGPREGYRGPPQEEPSQFYARHPSPPYDFSQDYLQARINAINASDMPVQQAQQAIQAEMKREGQRVYQRLLKEGKTPAEALATAGPLMFCDDPSAMIKAAAMAQATAPPAKQRVTPRAPESGEGTMVAGTGFYVTDDGYLVTCAHVVQGATSFHVKSPGGSIPAKLIKKDRTIDVALLKVDGAFRALPVAPAPRVQLGDAVFTIGFPNPVVQGIEPKLTRGEISSMAGIHDNPSYFQISVPVQPGNSGGALVDENGNVVGVIASRLDDAKTWEISGSLPQNVNYAVKGGLVRNFLNAVPELSGKLKAQHTARDREAASAAAERAAVLVIAE